MLYNSCMDFWKVNKFELVTDNGFNESLNSIYFNWQNIENGARVRLGVYCIHI